jgi:hypothetical protein
MIVTFLRINFSGSCKRADWLFADIPSLYVSSPHPSFGTNKNGQPGTDATEYGWLLWQEHTAPTVRILPTEDSFPETSSRETCAGV